MCLPLLFLNIKTQAITKMHQPDLFFGVNALAIEESEFQKWLEMKYPDFREWAKGWDDLNQSNEFMKQWTYWRRTFQNLSL